jgi:hypothetical protein
MILFPFLSSCIIHGSFLPSPLAAFRDQAYYNDNYGELQDEPRVMITSKDADGNVLKQKHILALYDAEAAVTAITTVRPSATYSYFGNRIGTPTEDTTSLCYLQYPPRGDELATDVPCLTRTVQSVFKTASSTSGAWNDACDENYIPRDSCRNYYENVLTDDLLFIAIQVTTTL